jgi:hypothetical protein
MALDELSVTQDVELAIVVGDELVEVERGASPRSVDFAAARVENAVLDDLDPIARSGEVTVVPTTKCTVIVGHVVIQLELVRGPPAIDALALRH